MQADLETKIIQEDDIEDEIQNTLRNLSLMGTNQFDEKDMTSVRSLSTAKPEKKMKGSELLALA